MCLYYRGSFKNRYALFTENGQSQTLNLVLWNNSGYLLGYLYCFIASYIGYIYKRHRPRTLLNASRRRFGVEFIWEGILFHIFEPKTLKLLSPFLTWYGLVTLRFKSLCFCAGLFECDNLKMSAIKAGLKRFIVLYISKHRQLNLTVFIVFFSVFV